MITDGKPSALTLEDGAFIRMRLGWTRCVISRTLEEAACVFVAGDLIKHFHAG